MAVTKPYHQSDYLMPQVAVASEESPHPQQGVYPIRELEEHLDDIVTQIIIKRKYLWQVSLSDEYITPLTRSRPGAAAIYISTSTDLGKWGGLTVRRAFLLTELVAAGVIILRANVILAYFTDLQLLSDAMACLIVFIVLVGVVIVEGAWEQNVGSDAVVTDQDHKRNITNALMASRVV